MKKILLFFLFAQNVCAQEWQTIPKEYFNDCCNLVGEPHYVYKKFKIDPHTNDLWMAYGSSINHLTNDGVYSSFNPQNEPLFASGGVFYDFAFFTNGSVFSIKSDKGLYRYKNDIWEIVLSNITPYSLAADNDTVFITQTSNKSFYRFYENTSLEGNYQYFKRTAHLNGKFWGSESTTSFISYFENGLSSTYDPDTCALLNITNYDFKLSKYDNNLYIAGSRGLSVASGRTFIDTISAFTSTNMPNAGIIEFEFDSKNNIWALIGSNPNDVLYENHAVAYYDQSTRTWSNYYDATNSPIDFTQLLTIEVDTAGNLWVAERDKLHVLKINETPAWLAAPELQNPVAVDLYPNPGTEKLHVRFKQEVKQAQSLKLRNVMGQLVLEQEMHSGEQNYEFSTTTLPQGIYFLDLGAQKQWRKWIKL